MAINAPDEETMNEVISERYGHPPHECEEHIDITQNVYPSGMDMMSKSGPLQHM